MARQSPTVTKRK